MTSVAGSSDDKNGEREEVAAVLLRADTLLHHDRRQTRWRRRQTVLYIDLGEIGIGAGLETPRLIGTPLPLAWLTDSM